MLLAACMHDTEGSDDHDEHDDYHGNKHHHPGRNHILQVHAWTPTWIQGYQNGRHDAFFLVLSRLDYTLAHKLDYWRKRTVEVSPRMVWEQDQKQRQSRLKFWKFKDKKNKNTNSSNSNSYNAIRLHAQHLLFWLSRLQLTVDLAHAIEFLHSKRILHRDLKPDNIGFEDENGLTGASLASGTLKVFDFDVARVLPDAFLATSSPSRNTSSSSSSSLPLFKLTKRVGSPRYMSPECARGDQYNETADVYTAGLLTFELLTLAKPYHDVAPEDHDEQIFQKAVRPRLPPMLSHKKALQVAATMSRKMSKVNHQTWASTATAGRTGGPSSSSSLPLAQNTGNTTTTTTPTTSSCSPKKQSLPTSVSFVPRS